MQQAVQQQDLGAEPAWALRWLTPRRGRILLALVLLLGFLGHLRYLTNDCPLDLSGDEAHYWDWSRQLDLCYYSKGPLVAWIIRASCALLGDTMLAVRLPALVLAVGTSLLTWWLARRLFGSEKLALGAVLLAHVVPMFIAGSVLMTIDPPFYFCWALATCLAVPALAGNRWAWIGIGIAVGLGFLAKFSMPLWFLGLGLYMAVDNDSRRWWRTPWPWLAIAVFGLFTIPVLAWNARHDWVSFLHVADNTVADESGDGGIGALLRFLGGQAGALGPPLAVILVGGIVHAALQWRRRQDEQWRAMGYLLAIGAPFWLIVAATCFKKEPQVNWPAPAYFTWIILAAHFLATRMRRLKSWRRWRGWLWGSIGLALVATPLLHNTELLYRPVTAAYRKFLHRERLPGKWDPTARLRGWKELGDAVSQELQSLGPDAMVMSAHYQTTAQLAFYVNGQPRTFYVGSWFADPEERSRLCQYDLWPDRRLDQALLLGKDALYVGARPPADFCAAFTQVERPRRIVIQRQGIEVRAFNLWRCHGFKGMTWPGQSRKF